MRTLTIQPFGGLCNRLRALLSASILADRMGRELEVDWVVDAQTCGSRLGDLFHRFPGVDAPPRTGLFDEVRSERDLRRIEESPPRGDLRIRSQIEMRPAGMDVALFEAELRCRLRALEPHREILDRVPELPSGTLGLHVRRADHWPATRYSPLYLFTRAIDLHDRGAADRIYLATDSSVVVASLQRRYGPRLHHSELRSRQRGTVPGVTDALVDLLTLSRTAFIYGSVHSSFSLTASRWGGAPLRVLSLPGAPRDYAGTRMDRLHLRLLRYEPEMARWIARTPRTWQGRLIARLLSPWIGAWLIRRANLAMSDAYQEGLVSLRF